ncbi:hypothetical protein KBC75_03425, partial [Candidatus Shapirobacteria bacterium]|nr:hypothetical protein [Candidatus Shapirobacteria bacterium]
VVAGGNVRHDYYQSLTTPFISIILGFGLYYLTNFVFKSKIVGSLIALTIFCSALAVSWGTVKNYYKINREDIIFSGKIVNDILPKNALVIAPFNGDTAFLYQTNRSGWPTEVYNISNLQKQHPNNPIYLLSLNNDQYRHEMEKEGKIIYTDNSLEIVNLTP